jgi:acetyl-CoA C-acetyltransferase
MSKSEEFIPVIIGVGQLIDQPAEEEDGLEPLSLIRKAIELANLDAGGTFLSRVDALDVENVSSWPYDNLEGNICNQVNINPTHCKYHDISGDSPIRNLCFAAKRIAAGISQVALVCGAESAWTIRRAQKGGKQISSWTPASQKPITNSLKLSSTAKKYQLGLPTTAYALYENAFRHKWGQTFKEGQKETAQIWARASELATNNSYAWIRKIYTAPQIETPDTNNRMIAWPYTKLMVANNFVNGGTAIILTNLALAKQAGIPEDKIIYCTSGGYANESDDILKRDNYHHSAAMETVLTHVLGTREIDYIEFYSCFPIVPKLAKKFLNWDNDKDLSLIGGMTFCGAQISNFMSQATVSMVKKLRQKRGTGFLYGNGHFLTHAAGLIISTTRPPFFPTQLDLQVEADALKEIPPNFVMDYEGPGQIETYTVVFDRDGNPDHAVIIGRTPHGSRFVAKSANGDLETISPLIDPLTDLIGLKGQTKAHEGFNIWSWT